LYSAKSESCRLFAHLRHHTISVFIIHTSICSVEKFAYFMSSIKFHIDLSFCPVALDYLDIFFFYLLFVLSALMHLVHSDPRAGLFRTTKCHIFPLTCYLVQRYMMFMPVATHFITRNDWSMHPHCTVV
jgi:hypothetical protein